MTDRIWLSQYQAGVPADADITAYPSINQIVAESCSRFRERPAFTNMGATISFGDLERLSRQFGAWLQQATGLKHGDRVAIMMPNCLQYPVALFGALRAGCTIVNVNPLYTPRELEHQLNDSGATAIVIIENFAHTLAAVIERTSVRTVVTTQLGDLLGFPKSLLVNLVVRHVKRMIPPWRIPGTVSMAEALARGARLSLQEPKIGPEDIAFLQYTGGTTGVSKGAMLTHGNMVANMQQAHAWLAPAVSDEGERVVTALPLYHIFALTANCLVFMKTGGLNILITNPRDMKGFVKELQSQPWSVITGVNTLFNGLLNTPGFDRIDFSGLRVSFGGGMAVQRAVAERWKAVTGSPLIEAYGLTETSPAACINPLNNREYTGAIGVPISSTYVSIRDEQMRELPRFRQGMDQAACVGEICIKGPQVMRGYHNRPDETAKVLTPDGWLRTGDLGYMDERGYIFIVDRKKDMILVSGFNVYPNDVEGVAVSHPGVLEAAAVGVPDERSGEAVKLVVVKKDPALTAEALIEHCRKELTAYKVPRIVEFRTSLPKTNVGKILRRELRDSPSTGT
jgi:long-chain acyl-CoA synthetase